MSAGNEIDHIQEIERLRVLLDHCQTNCRQLLTDRRTPGTIEVCKHCRDTGEGGRFTAAGRDRTARCPVHTCPVRGTP